MGNILSAAFRGYASLCVRAYYRRMHYIGTENVPGAGNAVVLAGNHQNCMMDPLNVEVALRKRKPYCITRGDVFKVGGIATKFLYWLRLLPVTRSSFDGVSAASAKEANRSTFAAAEECLNKGNALIIFPEAGHQDKRWLGYFSLAYLTMAFQAAERMSFAKEVYVVPFAHHYENYFHPFRDFMLKFGEPVPLSQFYELYKTKPRTAMRKANEIVEGRIREMMLDIRDLDHYTGIDELRKGPYGRAYAMANGFNPGLLYEKLESDKKMAAVLEKAVKDEPEKTTALLDRLQALEKEILSLGMRDWVVAERPGRARLLLRIAALAVLLPVAAAAISLTWPFFLIPKAISIRQEKRNGDFMFRSTWQVGSLVLITAPLLWILPVIVTLFFAPCAALGYFVACPLMLAFCILYKKFLVKTKGVWNYVTGSRSEALSEERESIIKEINKIK